MVAPKGRTYTPTRGPLAGQTFRAPANARGETAAYNAYQNALARHYGAPSYGALKTQRVNPLYVVAFERARDAKGQTRYEAHATARRIIGNTRIPKSAPGAYGAAAHPRGQEMRRIIRDLMDEGLYDTGDEAADEMFYE